MEARDVHNRGDLLAYLSQCLTGDYYDVVGDDEVRQRSTFVKTYLVESHVSDLLADRQFRSVFPQAHETSDPHIVSAVDDYGVPYFIDTAGSRYMAVHTIGLARHSDRALERLAQGETGGFDRAWMPADQLLAIHRGQLTGLKFGREQIVSGILDEERAR